MARPETALELRRAASSRGGTPATSPRREQRATPRKVGVNGTAGTAVRGNAGDWQLVVGALCVVAAPAQLPTAVRAAQPQRDGFVIHSCCQDSGSM